MDFSRFSTEKLLPILVNRTVIFFFLMCLLALFLYMVGTFQEFIDSTQITLLKVYSVLGIFLTVTSVSGVIIYISRMIITRKAGYLLRAGGYLALTIFGAATVLAAIVIIAISGGNVSG
jgi:hypothetical protein